MENIKEKEKIDTRHYREELEQFCYANEIYQRYEIKNLADVHLTSYVEYEDGDFEYGRLTLNGNYWWTETEIFRQKGVIDVESAVYDEKSNQLDIVFTIKQPGHDSKNIRKFSIILEELLKEMKEKKPGH